MLYYCEGNILSLDKGIIVHGCNAEGIMGAGLALQVKEQYPDLYKRYKEYVKGFTDATGTVNYYHVNAQLLIANAITQPKRGKHASLLAIEECFNEIVGYAMSTNRKVHTVKIGCGYGGLKWQDVSKLLESYYIDMYIWEPQ